MKVLITGAQGQVGRALLAAPPAHAEIVAMGRAELDIGVADAVAEAVRQHRPDVIINAAAYTAVDRAESEPEVARVANELGPKHLADAAHATGARLIHVSTDFVFDGRSSLAYAPDATPNPLNVYGATKLAGERAVQAVLPERSVILRTAWLYAAEGRNFVRTMLRLMQNERIVRVVTDQIGTPTAAHSVAQGALAFRGAPGTQRRLSLDRCWCRQLVRLCGRHRGGSGCPRASVRRHRGAADLDGGVSDSCSSPKFQCT